MQLTQHQRTSGFTILELMVASAVFSIILLVIAAGAVSFTNSYFKGITSNKTQAAARSIMAALAQSIQFGTTVHQSTGLGGAQGLCIDNTLYTYVVGQEVADSSPQATQHQGYHGLVETTGSDCSGVTPVLPNTTTLPTGSRELLGQHMRLAALTITPSGALYAIRVRVVYGDDALLTPTIGSNPAWPSEFCAGNQSGSQFCAISDLTTTVEQRL